MPVSADTIALLVQAGLSGEQLVEIVRSIDADMSGMALSSDSVTERKRAADRERMRQKRDVARQSRDMSRDALPSPEQKTPTPLKTQPLPTEPPSPPTGAHTPIGKPAKRENGSFLRPDWQPSDDELAFGVAELGSREAALRQLEKFRNFWLAKSGADGRKRDWGRTWRNWIMNEVDRGGKFRNSNGSGRQQPVVGHAAIVAAARQRLGQSADGGGGPPGVSEGLDAQRDGSGVYRLANF